MTGSSEEDLERIASRLAMVVSEDGEAANAGRAIGHLARRLGLTGGDLKEIFMAGAAAGDHARVERQNTGEIERLQREISALRSSLRMVESNNRVVERERDALNYEVAALRTTLERRASGNRLQRILVTCVVVAAVVALAVGMIWPPLRNALTATGRQQPLDMAGTAAPVAGAHGRDRMGNVHVSRATVFEQPDRAAPVVATLHAGMPVVIHRLFWNMLVQWAEIDVGNRTGYVLTTDIDLS